MIRQSDMKCSMKITAEGEIEMPELIEHALLFIDENNFTFLEAMKAGKLSVEGRTKGWTKSFKKAIEPALPLLGLKN